MHDGGVRRASGAEQTNVVELESVSVVYESSGSKKGRGRDAICAVDNVDLAISLGGTLGLVGATGSGKSTIAHLITGLTKPTDGRVLVGGVDLGAKGDDASHGVKVQAVMQDPYSSLDPRMTVAQLVAEPLTLGRPLRLRRPDIRSRVSELLRLVGLPNSAAEKYPHQFSGGQRQRIAIARALAPEPDLVVLDEPTSALDVSVRAQILILLKRLQDRLGLSYLVISHDLITVAYLATSIAVMHRGRVVESGPSHQVYARPAHPYTALLLASAPGSNERRGPLPALGMPADSEGCTYAAICGLCQEMGDPDECHTVSPFRIEIEAGRTAECHFAGQGAMSLRNNNSSSTLPDRTASD